MQTANNELTSLEWAELVEQVKADDEAGLRRLYNLFNKSIHDYLRTQLGPQELEYKVDDMLLRAVHKIKHGRLSKPEQVMRFVSEVVRDYLATYVETPALQHQLHRLNGEEAARLEHSPKQQVITKQKAELMRRALEALPQRDREILIRSYLNQQSQEQICKELFLTETQFRLLRSRARFKLGEISRRMLAPQTTGPANLPNSSSQTPLQQRHKAAQTSSHLSETFQKHSSMSTQDTNVDIFMAAAIAFQDVSKGKLWLITPNESFNRNSPLSVINSVEGRQKILNELALIEHGMF